jgi:hypothetical protein
LPPPPPPQNQLERSQALVARAHALLARVFRGEGGDVPLKDISDFISISHAAFREKTRLTKILNPLGKSKECTLKMK